jgi:hypothetical protein
LHRLPRPCAVTVSGLQVLSTTWKSTDGTRSHWKYVVDNVIVYRDVYRGSFSATIEFRPASESVSVSFVASAMTSADSLLVRRGQK